MFDKRRIRKHGLPAEATVVSVEQRSKITSNELRDFDHVLDVRPDDPAEPPFQTEVREKLWMIGLRPKEGDVLRVKYDPKSHEAVFQFDGDPRYDVEASQERTKAMRLENAEMAARIEARGPASPATVVVGAAGDVDPLDRIEQLVRLRDAGALTPEEFAQQKQRILAEG